tara:strand:- start:1952 stop:3205 length:1254 start_codon:yes stop_codon:yes gene_type:complete
MGFGQRAGKFNELGRIQSIKPASQSPLTQVDSYTITSTGQPASVIHARDPIFKPGTETVLESDATFFTPTESYGSDGVPQYSQYVVNDAINPSVPVGQYKEYFTVTNPGVMSTFGSYANSSNGGAATLTPRALSEPSTFRKEGLVQVYLTTSNDADPEVAYSDEGVNWCAIGFDNFFFNLVAETAAVSSSYRTFKKYLNSAGTTNFAFAQTPGQYSSNANSFGTGDITYNTSGIYRSQVVPFFKKNDGTQYYLKTNVTFTAASVNSTAGNGGSISPVGFVEYDVSSGSATPTYTVTPDSGKHIISVKLDGVALTITDASNAESYVFGTTSGVPALASGQNKSLEATFGNKLTLTTAGSGGSISTSSPQYVAIGGSVTIAFSEEPVSITLNGITQTVDGASFVASGFTADSVLIATFS